MEIQHTNLLRIISIIAVLVIHSTYVAQKNFSIHLNLFSIDMVYVLLNQFCRFSVPVFIILSGYGLTSKYHNQKLEIKEFYKKRFLKIAFPFIFWTIVLLLFRKKFSFDISFIKDLIYFLTITGIDYHFYFFIIILQCYIFFPILFKINHISLLIVLLILQLLTYSPTDKLIGLLGLPYPSLPSTFIFSWLFYFYFGIYLKKNEEKIYLFLKRSIFLLNILLISTLLIIFYEYIHFSFRNLPFSYFDHFHRYSVLFYSLSFYLIYYYAINKISVNYLNNIQQLSSITFSVYIFHTQILRLLDLFLFEFIFLKTLILIIFSFGLFYLISNFINYITKYNNIKNYINYLKYILGL
jgi:surface polysaccharide O-acyltransferase-like enzyme